MSEDTHDHAVESTSRRSEARPGMLESTRADQQVRPVSRRPTAIPVAREQGEVPTIGGTALRQFRREHFTLVLPRQQVVPPTLVVAAVQQRNPSAWPREDTFAMKQICRGLWALHANDAQLQEGTVYRYWFRIPDTNPYRAQGAMVYITDPQAGSVDWSCLSPGYNAHGYTQDDRAPAGVVIFKDGELRPADISGATIDWGGEPGLMHLPTNRQMVIYQAPPTWMRVDDESTDEAVGTFRDLTCLVDQRAERGNLAVTRGPDGGDYLGELGCNAIQVTPINDSFEDRMWGYATSNYYAPDYDLGRREDQTISTALRDLCGLVKTCHQHGTRLLCDAVMAFSNRDPYHMADFPDMHVKWDSGDPEQGDRNAFGGDLWKYNYWINNYDPVTGGISDIVPARQHMLDHIAWWVQQYHIDGVRIDSANNIANYDFIQQFTDHARNAWDERWAGATPQDRDDRFITFAEELSVPRALLDQKRVDGLWNENFKRIVRSVILGRNWDQEPSFELSVMKMIDCRLMGCGFTDLTQAINYVTSHDISGEGNQRLFNYLTSNGIIDTEPRIRLAFACLMTAVGIPMILAGEEFADEEDLDINRSNPAADVNKQIDPVHYGRLQQFPWRQQLFRFVARLAHLRRTDPSLQVNDTRFIHRDFNDGKRVMAWWRGQPGSSDAVVVVANFSDWGTADPTNPDARYDLQWFPPTPAGCHWREITQGRDIPEDRIGREPLLPWDAKVYALV